MNNPASSSPSPREAAQNAIVEFLAERSGFFNAPYGVLPGVKSLPRGGKLRQVTFGVARYLDATITILQPDRITLQGRGPMISNFTQFEFRSVDELKAELLRVIGS